jgi:DNA polymerase-3 subunit delta
MFNKEIEREIKEGFPKPVYYLWGDHSAAIDDIISQAVNVVVGTERQAFNFDVFDKTATASDILNSAMTIPIAAKRRLVLLKHFQDFTPSQQKAIIAYIERPNATACMIVLSDKSPDNITKKNLNWKTVNLGVTEKDMPQWVRVRAEELGFQLSAEALDYLIERVGIDKGLLSMELDKIALMKKKHINSEDIASSTGATRDYSAFELFDAIIDKNSHKAFKILRNLLGAKGVYSYEISGALNWCYEQYYMLWESNGKRPQKMRYDTYNKLSPRLRQCNKHYFLRIFKALHQADVHIKSSGNAEAGLEMLLLNLLLQL